MKLKKVVVGLMLMLILSACSSNSVNNSNNVNNNSNMANEEVTETSEKLQVVATNSIIADIAKNVGGDAVEVYSIVPIGTDPHEYEPLPSDMAACSDADVIFYNGLNLETGNGWFDDLMETTGKIENQDYFVVSTGVDVFYLTSEGNEGEADPHAWLDIENGIIYAKNMAEIMAEKDPENSELYNSNLETYTSELMELHEEYKDEFSDIPDNKKLLVTSEGAFKYFSRAYGVTAAYIWEINTENQGTPEQMTTIIDTINEWDVPVLFVETSVDSRSMEQVASETNLPIYCTIFTDSLAAEGEDGDTYYSMMKWNLEKIHEGLSQ